MTTKTDSSSSGYFFNLYVGFPGGTELCSLAAVRDNYQADLEESLKVPHKKAKKEKELKK